MGPPQSGDGTNLDAVVNEVVAEAHLRPDELRPEEREYLKAHALKRPLRVFDIWALGVGVVIAGAYFGWNLGLKGNGPVAMLIASLLVCLLYLIWVLALAELTVAMPFAGGPLAYGRRAADPSLGFVMGWSMYLECLFAGIAAVMAAGGYVAFLLHPIAPDPLVKMEASLATVAIFFLLQAWGVKEQSWAMMVMTWGAILGLVIFCIAAATHFSWERVWPRQNLLHGKGWRAVLDAVPYALWWLVMIETVALAAEEAHEPHRTVPRGLVWAQMTLIALVVLTCVFACGALDSQEVAVKQGADGKAEDIEYPLAEVIRRIPVGQDHPVFLRGFGLIALFGLIASYHGMIYGSSRQAFALGRAGYLPAFLGTVHKTRRTPVASLLTCSLITSGFVIANYWYKDAIAAAVLISTLTALVWYILSMGCLFVLRKREPHLFRTYRAPVYRVLPITVILLSVFAVYVYTGIDVKIVPLTALFYALGLAYYWFWGHARIQHAAPEELSARQAALPPQHSTKAQEAGITTQPSEAPR
jgi:ethanolamine permease